MACIRRCADAMVQLTIQHAFNRVFGHHQAGRLREAELLYRQILAQQPRHAPTLHYLGVLAYTALKIPFTRPDSLGLV